MKDRQRASGESPSHRNRATPYKNPRTHQYEATNKATTCNIVHQKTWSWGRGGRGSKVVDFVRVDGPVDKACLGEEPVDHAVSDGPVDHTLQGVCSIHVPWAATSCASLTHPNSTALTHRA